MGANAFDPMRHDHAQESDPGDGLLIIQLGYPELTRLVGKLAILGSDISRAYWYHSLAGSSDGKPSFDLIDHEATGNKQKGKEAKGNLLLHNKIHGQPMRATMILIRAAVNNLVIIP